MRKSVSNRNNHSDLIQRRVAARHDSTNRTQNQHITSVGACSDWCYMLILCAVCRVVARRDSTLYQVAVIVPVWNGFSHGYEYENEWLCILYGRMIIRPYTLWHLYEFYVILLNNTTKILWNMPQEIIFATFVVASAAIIQRLRQTLHNEKAS